jgi:septum formation protein
LLQALVDSATLITLMNLPTLILASASPRRAELLRQLDLSFEILPSSATELVHDQLSGGELSQLNAYRKARAVSKQHPDALVLGVDTVVALGAKLFGKPSDLNQARSFLKTLQGKTHHVFTGVCMIHLREHRQRIFVEATEVKFRSLGKDEIEHYLSRVNPLDKAGAYAIQEHGDDIVRNIHGSFSNVVGLPLERLRHELLTFSVTAGETAFA